MRKSKRSLEHDQLQVAIRDWGKNNEEITAILVIGSRARPNPSVDRFSDLDLIVFVNDSSRLVNESSWIAEINKPWISVLSQTGSGDPEWVIIFSKGLKAGFVISEERMTSNLDQIVQDSVYRFVLDQGYTILYEKNSPLPNPRYREPAVPASSTTFTDVNLESLIDKVIIYCYQVTRYTARNDLWRALQALAELRNKLLVLMEWHFQSKGGSNLLKKYEGRDILEWVDPNIKPDLIDLLPSFDQKQLIRGVEVSLDILEYLTAKITAETDDALPSFEQKEVMGLIRSICVEFA